MSISLSPDEHLARARADFRMGVGVVLRAGDKQWLAVSAETVSQERFHAMKSSGAVELVITNWRAEKLNTMGPEADLVRLYVPKDRDLDWVYSMANPVDDDTNPTTGPFETICSTESEPHRVALAICKMALLLPAVLLVEAECGVVEGLHCVDLDVVREGLENGASPLRLVADAPVPLSYSKASKVHVFRPIDGGEEHYAIEIGNPDRQQPVLSRLHSACFTGDVIGSLKCDCGPQLNGALERIAQEGGGVLLYLNQEGRGIGLANKMRAYTLQAQGHDTVDANHHLGFEDDERNFTLGAEILTLLGFSKVRLMTNNPKKVRNMELSGLEIVERVPLVVGENPLNEQYLKVKAQKSGHLL